MTTDGAVRARRRVMFAVATLGDVEYQRRVWIRRELPLPDYYDELDEAVHVLFDDYLVLPKPTPDKDGLLLAGAEITRLQRLGEVFDSMIDRLNDVATSDSDYLNDPEWPTVVDLARHALPALILAGGWEYADTDAQVHRSDRAEFPHLTVDLPATRRRVVKAVAALADDEYQRRTWPGGTDPVTGSLSACLHALTDDTAVLPDPSAAIGRVLVAGDEIARLTALGSALNPFKGHLPAQPWQHPEWEPVVHAALNCLPAPIIADAWMGPDPND